MANGQLTMAEVREEYNQWAEERSLTLIESLQEGQCCPCSFLPWCSRS